MSVFTRRLRALLMTAVLSVGLFCLSGCGGDDNPSGGGGGGGGGDGGGNGGGNGGNALVCGDGQAWVQYFEEGDYDLEGEGFAWIFRSDKTAYMCWNGISEFGRPNDRNWYCHDEEGRWSVNGDKVRITFEGDTEEFKYSVSGKTLTLYHYEDGVWTDEYWGSYTKTDGIIPIMLPPSGGSGDEDDE